MTRSALQSQADGGIRTPDPRFTRAGTCPTEGHAGHGGTAVHPTAGPEAPDVGAGRDPEQDTALRPQCAPRVDDHWVYLAHDSEGELLYVGVTGRGLERLHAHHRASAWAPLVYRVDVEHYSSRDAALDRERQLIRDRRPPYNVASNGHRNDDDAEIVEVVPRQELDRLRELFAAAEEALDDYAKVLAGAEEAQESAVRERDEAREALAVAADDLFKAANQFAQLVPDGVNADRFTEKAERALRAAGGKENQWTGKGEADILSLRDGSAQPYAEVAERLFGDQRGIDG